MGPFQTIELLWWSIAGSWQKRFYRNTRRPHAFHRPTPCLAATATVIAYTKKHCICIRGLEDCEQGVGKPASRTEGREKLHAEAHSSQASTWLHHQGQSLGVAFDAPERDADRAFAPARRTVRQPSDDGASQPFSCVNQQCVIRSQPSASCRKRLESPDRPSSSIVGSSAYALPTLLSLNTSPAERSLSARLHRRRGST